MGVAYEKGDFRLPRAPRGARHHRCPRSRNYEVIIVKGLEVNSGVVMLAVQQGSTSFQLQCNANVPGCNTLQPGSYVMVRLPKNWGTYVCVNVEVYPTPIHPENLGDKLGAYCLIQK